MAAWRTRAGWLSAIAPAAIFAPDGQTIDVDPLDVVWLGAAPRSLGAPPSMIAADPSVDVALLAGGDYRRSPGNDWLSAVAHPDVPVIACVSGRDHRSRAAIHRWSGAYPAQGARGATWGAFDVVSQGHRWRFVRVDPDRRALSDEGVAQRFWLPSVVHDDAIDHLVVLHAAPPPGRRGDLDDLLDIVDEHTRIGRWALTLAGGPSTVPIDLPDGPFGPATLTAGIPTSGWWRLQIHGGEVRASVEGLPSTSGTDGTAEWARATGWVVAP